VTVSLSQASLCAIVLALSRITIIKGPSMAGWLADLIPRNHLSKHLDRVRRR